MDSIDFRKYNINAIVRPANKARALKQQLDFMVRVLSALGLTFSYGEQDPLRLVEQYIEGSITIQRCKVESLLWWKKVDDSAAIHEFEDRDILMARLAICLLSNDEEDVSSLGDNLSWFLEVLGFLGADTRKSLEMMIDYFDFR